MSLYPSGGHHGRGGLLILAMAASMSTLVISKDSRFTWADCQASAASSPSPASSPSSSSSSSINSTFWSNVVALLAALPSATAPTGFATLSHSSGTDRAFVRGMCRGDSTPASCAKHLRNAAVEIQSRCNSSSRRAAIWYDDGSTVTYPAPMFCFVSYADTNASTSHEDGYRQELQKQRSGLRQERLREYLLCAHGSPGQARRRQWLRWRRRHTIAACAAAAPSPPAPMFATGEAVYDDDPAARNGTIYGLLQCMRDRTAAECDKCLKDSVRELLVCCYGHQGGVVLAYNCYLRMDIYTYYDLALDGPPPILAPAPSMIITGVTRGKKMVEVTLPVTLAVGTVVAAVVIIGVFHYKRKANQQNQTTQDTENSKEDDTGYIESEHLNLLVLRAATNNFSKENKLGEGGFGEVFKGTLPDGEEIAVKKLSQNSSQGFDELKNELVLAAKLKHKNLVQLLGVSLQEEKLLIYEYMPNRSLDTFLFDPVRRQQLDWNKRFAIICGIARGLYLHEESRLKVIHRDLKPSNVLLDADMNPKISDFGIARAFHGDQSTST